MSESTPSRWRRRKEARPGEIIHAALACFQERGFAATRLEDVAVRAGVTKGTIYLYYPSKEDLFKAVIQSELVPNLESLESALDPSGSALEQLQQLFTVFVHHIAPSPASVIPKLVLAEAGNFPEIARFYRETVAERGLRLIRAILNRGITRGEFRPVDVDQVVFCIIGPLIFSLLAKQSLTGVDGHPIDLAAVCRAHLDLLGHGLLRDPSVQLPTLSPSGEA